MELRGDDLERRIQLPWVARVQLRPVDEETRQALEPEDCDWTLVPADRSERAEDEPLGLYFAPRGSYKVLFLCSGRLPATCAFTVVGTETLVKVEIPLRKGEAGVLSGTVVARGTRRSLRCGVRFEHRATGMGYSVQCPEGRFRLSGLMAGEYVLFVWGAGPLREFRFTIAENEKKQDLVLEKDPG